MLLQFYYNMFIVLKHRKHFLAAVVHFHKLLDPEMDHLALKRPAPVLELKKEESFSVFFLQKWPHRNLMTNPIIKVTTKTAADATAIFPF